MSKEIQAQQAIERVSQLVLSSGKSVFFNKGGAFYPMRTHDHTHEVKPSDLSPMSKLERTIHELAAFMVAPTRKGFMTLADVGAENDNGLHTKALVTVIQIDCDGRHYDDFLLCAGCQRDLIEAYEAEASSDADGCRQVEVYYFSCLQFMECESCELTDVETRETEVSELPTCSMLPEGDR